MHPQRWQQVEEIFQAALDLVPGERERYITKVCAGDDALKHEVETLLTQYEKAGDFIDEPVYQGRGLQALAALMKEEADDPLLGQRLGAYRIEREIGRGGMGTVYEAVRADNAFRKRVAAKVVKRGMDTDFILRRFRNERQILANLDHPNIARLLDGGTTNDGLPFFIMEYIEGRPLYHYCDAQHLSIRERLNLFRFIADAVHYAHQAGIVHRDIKPSNILIAKGGVPKLLDFGIAKLLNPELSADTIDPTLTAMRLMTPEYASPEQINGESASPASDIYSLGVLLYELLTGHRPYHLKNRALHEIARVICEEEPERLSASITRADGLVSTDPNEAATLEFIYQARSASLETLRRELAGDLERIVMKALRKEPVERYQTAQELRDDITRYLEGQPVLAPPYAPSPNRRTPASNISSEGARPEGISFAVLPFKLIGAPKKDDTGDEYLGVGLADALITRLSNVRRFIVRPTSSVLRYSQADDPLVAGQELAVDFIVDGNIRRVGETLRVTAQLLSVGEGATRWAGRFDEKMADVLQLEDSISEQVACSLLPQLSGDEREQLKKRGTDNAEAFEAYLRGRYHWNLLTEENFAKAINYYQRAVTLDSGYAAAYAAIAEYYGWLAIFSIQPPAECLAAAREAARRAVELDDTLAEAYTALGFALLGHASQWETAGVHFRRAIELNPNYPMAHVWYGCQLAMEGRFREADAQLQTACELDPLNPFNAYNRQWCLYQAGRFEESIKQGHALLRSDANYSPAYFALSWALRRTGALDEALDAAKKAVKLGGEIPLNLAARGAAYAEAGRTDKARRVLAQLEEMAPQRYVTPYHRALIHLHLGERERALELLEQSVTDGEPWVVWLGVEPQFESLRADSRFIELLRRTHNPAAPHFVVRETSSAQAASSREKVGARTRPMTSAPATGEKVVAVLPLKVLNRSASDTTGDDYLGIGLADALITRLSSIRSLRVRPTSSVLRYSKDDTDPLAAGRELNADYVVDGHLRRVGDRIRVTAQLLNVSESATRWAAQFDEHSADVLQLEDSISAQVAGALVPHLSGHEHQQLKKQGTNNPEAFEAYLRGRYYWNTFTEEGFAKALVCYNQAVAYAPDYALAYAGIADYYNWLGVYAVLPFSETSAAAKEAALKAVTLDETLSEGYAALGFATLMHDFDWELAERHLSRAVELNPNYVMGRLWYCYFLGMAGRFDEALAQVSRALELDPLTPIVQHALSWTYYHGRHYEEAAEAVRKLAREEPRYGLGLIFLCVVLLHMKQFEEAIKAGRKAVEVLGRTPYTLAWLASAYASAGRREKADALLEEIEQMAAARYVSPYLLAAVYCNLGDKERAFTELERALSIRDARLVWLGVDPQLDCLRRDPRFTALLEETNNPAVARRTDTEASQLRVGEEEI
ncbi:MAG TPA: protein kinase [Pyrinomonadaceae bacterium]|jgi:serine/threonine protein kinase/Flp pilus assembly protein TadD